MLSIELDVQHQKRLQLLAQSHGEDESALARRILLDYLDFQAIPDESDAAWAEASIALAPEIMGPETWDGSDHGS